jgi:hypothetical protein
VHEPALGPPDTEVRENAAAGERKFKAAIADPERQLIGGLDDAL